MKGFYLQAYQGVLVGILRGTIGGVFGGVVRSVLISIAPKKALEMQMLYVYHCHYALSFINKVPKNG